MLQSSSRSRKHGSVCPHCRRVARRGCCSHRRHNNNSNSRTKLCPNCRGILRDGHDCCSHTIEYHWKGMPTHVKDFILNQGHLNKNGFINLVSLVKFWSAPQNKPMTQRVDICGAAWYLVSTSADGLNLLLRMMLEVRLHLLILLVRRYPCN